MAVSLRLHFRLSPLKRLSSPMEAANRLRGAMRGGFLSSSSVLGAGMLIKLEVNCDARQGVGRGAFGVARTPSQAKPASNSWSAVSPLKSTAGWPFRVVEPQSVFKPMPFEQGAA